MVIGLACAFVYVIQCSSQVFPPTTPFVRGSVFVWTNAADARLRLGIPDYYDPTNGITVETLTEYVSAATNTVYTNATDYVDAHLGSFVTTNDSRALEFSGPFFLQSGNFAVTNNSGTPTFHMQGVITGSATNAPFQAATNYTANLVRTNESRATRLSTVGFNTDPVPGRLVRINGILDLNGAYGIYFAGVDGDYSYQIVPIVNGMAYDTWSKHVFRYGANGAETVALTLQNANATLVGWLNAAGFTNAGFSGTPSVLVSDTQKRMVESGTALSDLATDEEAVQAALNATNAYNTHVAATYATKAEQQSGTNIVMGVVATKAGINAPTIFNPTFAGTTVNFGGTALEGSAWGISAAGKVNANLFEGPHSGNGASLTDISQGGVVGLFDALTYLTNRIVTTNGFVTATITNGLAPTNWVGLNFYPLTGNPSGFLSSVDLSDITQSEAAVGNFPMWNGAAWVPKGGSPTLGDFLIYAADGWANTNNIHPSRIGSGGAQEGNFLYWDGSEWAGVELGLSDISVGNASLGQVVKQVGGAWSAVDLSLSDIGQSGASAGQTIEWTAGGWAPVTRSDTLTTLSATATAGDFPRYDGAGGWTNAAFHVALSDIDSGGANAADVMVYNPGAGGWQPTPLDLDYLGQSGAGVGQVPKWNGDNWVPSEDGTGSSTWTFDDTTTETTDGSTWVTVGTWDIAANSTQMAELTLTATVDPTTGTRAIMKGIWTFARTTGAWSIPNNGFAALADVGGWMATNMRFNAVDNDTIALDVKGWTSETCKWIVVGTVRAH